MGRLPRPPLPHRQALNELTVFLSRAPKAATLPPAAYIRALRAALQMSQSRLARRAGVSQAHIALIESGRGDTRLGTLRKVFDALFCDLLVIPKPRGKRPSDPPRNSRNVGNPFFLDIRRPSLYPIIDQRPLSSMDRAPAF